MEKAAVISGMLKLDSPSAYAGGGGESLGGVGRPSFSFAEAFEVTILVFGVSFPFFFFLSTLLDNQREGVISDRYRQ